MPQWWNISVHLLPSLLSETSLWLIASSIPDFSMLSFHGSCIFLFQPYTSCGNIFAVFSQPQGDNYCTIFLLIVKENRCYRLERMLNLESYDISEFVTLDKMRSVCEILQKYKNPEEEKHRSTAWRSNTFKNASLCI